MSAARDRSREAGGLQLALCSNQTPFCSVAAGANWDRASRGEETAAAGGFLSVTPVEPLSPPPSIGQEVGVTTASTRRRVRFVFQSAAVGDVEGGAEMPAGGQVCQWWRWGPSISLVLKRVYGS